MVQIPKDRFALGSYQYLRYPFSYFLDTAVELEIRNVELWAAGPTFCLDTMMRVSFGKKRRKFGQGNFLSAVSHRNSVSIRSTLRRRTRGSGNTASGILNGRFARQRCWNVRRCLSPRAAGTSTGRWRRRGSGARKACTAWLRKHSLWEFSWYWRR